MTGTTAEITAIYLVIVALGFAHSFFACIKLAKVNAIFGRWEIGTGGCMHFMIPIRLSVFVNVVVVHFMDLDGVFMFCPRLLRAFERVSYCSTRNGPNECTWDARNTKA